MKHFKVPLNFNENFADLKHVQPPRQSLPYQV
jgi:hypothetical protein